MNKHGSMLIAQLLIVAVASTSLAAVQTQQEPDRRSVETQMRSVMYHFTGSIAVQIRRLHGRLVPKNELPVFDDKMSFTLQIESAEIAMSTESLANVLNSYIFAKPDAPLKGLSVRIDDKGRLKVKGKLHQKGDIPFEVEGRLSATADGKIRLHSESVRALHLPVKGLMDLLGIDISDLVNTGKVRGVRAEDDDLILDPQTMLPPPHIEGKVTQVRIEKNMVVQLFGDPRSSQLPMTVPAKNYMGYRGNQLRFGKLTMNDTDMILIDMDPKDGFDFYLDRYREQLTAGFTKITPSFGLRVFMRDYNKLAVRSPAAR
jgi:hypothetical protein